MHIENNDPTQPVSIVNVGNELGQSVANPTSDINNPAVTLEAVLMQPLIFFAIMQ